MNWRTRRRPVGARAETLAVAVALDPPPPLIVTVGAVVYPDPAFVTVMADTLLETTDATAVAVVP